jgi:hypothetical protein
MITALRESPRQLRSKAGSQLMIELIEIVIGTPWEEVLWPCNHWSDEDKRHLREAQEILKGTHWD